MPALDKVVFDLPDGTTQEFGTPGQGGHGTLQYLAEIGNGIFGRDGRPCCPICMDGEPTDKEHVPQKNLGGSVMTMTCKACNNGLGSKIEAALQDWFDHALRGVRFKHKGEVRGHRYVPTIYQRQAPDGSFALVIDGEMGPDVERMFAGRHFDMTYSPPDPRRCGLALLKHAYLAACLHLQSVPDTDEVHAIRADLIAARDTPPRTRPRESAAAKRMTVYRSPVGKQGPPLALVARHDPEGETEPETLISLAGALFVTWPFSDLQPFTWTRREAAG